MNVLAEEKVAGAMGVETIGVIGAGTIGVIGAGTMGAGIAQVAASAGHSVVLFDVASGAAQNGLQSIRVGLDKLIERGKKSQREVDQLCARITPADKIGALAAADLIIEAIVENVDIKRSVFSELEAICSEKTIIASNTSSISISALAAKLKHPERLIGMHFFNPAAILKLVEVVSGLHTSSEVANTVFDIAKKWGKTPVHAKSTPGFIVNRIARPYYAEALRSLNEQAASVATIDQIMRSSGGFRMGPFELMDLIGQDINLAVSESVYQAYYGDKRFQPSVLQAEMVAGGLLGRKTGRGYYDYSQDQKGEAEHQPVSESSLDQVTIYGDLGAADELLRLLEKSDVNVQRQASDQAYLQVGNTRLQLCNGLTATHIAANSGHDEVAVFDLARSYIAAQSIAVSVAKQASEQALQDVLALFSAIDKRVCVIKDLPGMLLMRTVCCLVNEAADVVNQGVCKAQDVDVAMKLGVNYPEGPMEWGARIGFANVVTVLANLQQSYGEERYRCSPWLLNQQFVK
ncbi:MAG: 3-hydroxybutyryl-CoA dehydrogenase [Arenicella sp.]|jgi:3-hydroxybutyryl-CoA dehydrogenase